MNRDELVTFVAESERICFANPWSVKSISDTLSSKSAVFAVKQPFGYAFGQLCGNDAELYRIAVLPEHRRCGFGSEILSEFIEICTKNRAGKIFLETSAQNSAAIEMYERVGFAQISARKNYYGRNNALCYELDISGGNCGCV